VTAGRSDAGRALLIIPVAGITGDGGCLVVTGIAGTDGVGCVVTGGGRGCGGSIGRKATSPCTGDTCLGGCGEPPAGGGGGGPKDAGDGPSSKALIKSSRASIVVISTVEPSSERTMLVFETKLILPHNNPDLLISFFQET